MQKQSSENGKRRIRIGKIVWSILIVLLVLLLCGYSVLFFNGLSGIYLKNTPLDGQIRIACVGDSITYGHGVSNWPKQNYPAVLQNILGDSYNVQNFGVSGCTVQSGGDQPYTATERYTQGLDYSADIVILMMGSNDSKPENWQDTEAFKAAYTALLDGYLNNAKTPQIYVCTPAKPFYLDGQTDGPTSFDICPEQVEQIAQIVRQIAEERGLPLIDIYTLTAEHAEWFEKDGVHPNADGAAAIAQAVKDAIQE